MSIVNYDQIVRVDTATSLPMAAADGAIAFAVDTSRHYMFAAGAWYKIPNASEVSNRRTYVNGVAQSGTPVTGDIVEWIETQSTNAGSAVFNVTTNRLSSGTAICSTIFPDSIQTNFIDSSGVYAQGNPTITSNKSISLPFTKQGFSGVTVIGINVLGSVSMATIPDGTVIKMIAIGIAA